jgi:electron transfer DM13
VTHSLRARLVATTAALFLLAAAGATAEGVVVLRAGKLSPLNNETAAGSVRLRLAGGKRVLQLRNANIGPRPALRVYLVAGRVDGNEDVAAFRDLGRLKSPAGNQQYLVRAAIDTNRYSTVVIWCDEFSVAFGKAALRRP